MIWFGSIDSTTISWNTVNYKKINSARLKHEWREIDNDHVLRNDHRIKTAQPISMILVLFFSEDNVLSDEIKIQCMLYFQI